MQEQNFKYLIVNQEIKTRKDYFTTIASGDYVTFVSDNTIFSIPFEYFFNKSDNEINKHFKGVLDSQSDNYFMSDHFSKVNKEQKVIEDWNKKEFYITPPTKENLDKMCNSFEQRIKNDSDKCGILNNPILERHSKIGQKHNEGKLPLDIMLTVQFPKAIQAVCKATLFGHEKYKDTDLDWLNYKRVRGGSTTYANACQRHNFNKSGKDDQSGLPHIVHKCWNALAELELWIEENKYE